MPVVRKELSGSALDKLTDPKGPGQPHLKPLATHGPGAPFKPRLEPVLLIKVLVPSSPLGLVTSSLLDTCWAAN